MNGSRTRCSGGRSFNVNVNAVAFGMIETRLTQKLTDSSTIDVQGRQVRVGVREETMAAISVACPLGRAGTPEEAAGAVLLLCSPHHLITQ